ERQLPKRRHRRLLVPLDPDRPEKTVQVDPFQPLRHNHRLLTRPVSPRRRRVALHALENARFSPSRQNQTAVSRVKVPEECGCYWLTTFVEAQAASAGPGPRWTRCVSIATRQMQRRCDVKLDTSPHCSRTSRCSVEMKRGTVISSAA